MLPCKCQKSLAQEAISFPLTLPQIFKKFRVETDSVRSANNLVGRVLRELSGVLYFLSSCTSVFLHAPPLADHVFLSSLL